MIENIPEELKICQWNWGRWFNIKDEIIYCEGMGVPMKNLLKPINIDKKFVLSRYDVAKLWFERHKNDVGGLIFKIPDGYQGFESKELLYDSYTEVNPDGLYNIIVKTNQKLKGAVKVLKMTGDVIEGKEEIKTIDDSFTFIGYKGIMSKEKWHLWKEYKMSINQLKDLLSTHKKIDITMAEIQANKEIETKLISIKAKIGESLKENKDITNLELELHELEKQLKQDLIDIKDQGSFVAAITKNRQTKNGDNVPSKKKNDIIFRTMLTIDIDKATPEEQRENVKKIKNCAFMYSTFSYTPEKPNIRIIIPFLEPLTPDEFVNVSQNYVKQLDFKGVCDSSHRTQQIMYFPTCPKDIIPFTKFIDGPLLDGKSLITETEDEKPKKTIKNNGREKTGPIGAFCRTYSITDVLNKFLYEFYEKSTENNKYTYINGSTKNGLLILDDDSLCISFHSSDEAGKGQQCNAFDLIKIHLHNNDLNKALKWCAELEEVKQDKEFQTEKNNKYNKKKEKITDFIKQIRKQGALIDNDEDVDWLYIDDLGITRVNTGVLSEYLRGKLKYIFIRNDATQGIQRYVYNNGVYGIVNDDEFRWHIKKYIPVMLRKSIHVNEVLKELYTDNRFKKFYEINPEKYINFKDGLFNIETWQLEKHTSKVLSTIQLPLCYPANKIDNSHVFDKYLDYLVNGDNDIKKLVLQFMGITISNVYGHRMKKSLFMVGTHDTGKSKIKELLIKLIGEQNANTLDLETLEARFGSSQILNKRLVGSNDMSYMKVKELKIFKLITGGDTQFAEGKGKDGYNFIYQGIAWFCCNELPKFSGDKGDGVYNRFVIIKCNEKAIPEEKQDKKLLEKMFDEREYILTLALKGLKEVIDNNYSYNIPQKCIDYLEDYKIDNDSFLKFFNECTESRSGKFDKVSKACIYRVYSDWCRDNNNGYKQNKNECQRLLEKLKMDEVKKTDGIRYYSNFTLNQDTYIDYVGINTIL